MSNIESDSFTHSGTSIFVHDLPLDLFLASENIQGLIKDNITITRNFDQRVKMFRTHILKGKNNPLCVDYYKWRIEFPLRGAAHVHGVLWLDLNKLDQCVDINLVNRYTDFKNAM